MRQANIKFDLMSIAIYLLTLVLFIGSYFYNADSGDTLKNIALNYAMPAFFLFVGLSVKGIPKWVTYISLCIGFALLIYLSLYYFIGFHNHYWGN